jgi:hypothetical protein
MARLPEDERIMLMDTVEAYLELTLEESEEYKILGASNHRRATAVWMTWSERMKEEGRKLGQQDGVRSLQQVLLRVLDQRFGPLPERVLQQVEGIASLRRLTQLAEKALIARSLRELRLR